MYMYMDMYVYVYICILQINVTSGNSERKGGDCGDPKDSRSMLQTNHKGKDKEGGGVLDKDYERNGHSYTSD